MFIISLLLVFAPICYALGIVLPLVRFEKLYFFSETPSLADIVASLYQNGDALLALLVAAFSIVFPFIKQLAVMLEVVEFCAQSHSIKSSRRTEVFGQLVPILSKWSMMDVLLVALVIVAAKTSGMADAFSQSGLWFYAASTFIVIIAQWLIRKYLIENGKITQSTQV